MKSIALLEEIQQVAAKHGFIIQNPQIISTKPQHVASHGNTTDHNGFSYPIFKSFKSPEKVELTLLEII